MKSPEGMDFTRLIDSAAKFIPVEAFNFETSATYKVLQKFGKGIDFII
jgi:hypothetical protein